MEQTHGITVRICFFRIQQQLRLLVATEDGVLYVYNVDQTEGGDLVLYRQHRLDGAPDDSAGKDLDKVDSGKRSPPQNIEGGNDNISCGAIIISLHFKFVLIFFLE